MHEKGSEGKSRIERIEGPFLPTKNLWFERAKRKSIFHKALPAFGCKEL